MVRTLIHNKSHLTLKTQWIKFLKGVHTLSLSKWSKRFLKKKKLLAGILLPFFFYIVDSCKANIQQWIKISILNCSVFEYVLVALFVIQTSAYSVLKRVHNVSKVNFFLFNPPCFSTFTKSKLCSPSLRERRAALLVMTPMTLMTPVFATVNGATWRRAACAVGGAKVYELHGSDVHSVVAEDALRFADARDLQETKRVFVDLNAPLRPRCSTALKT